MKKIVGVILIFMSALANAGSVSIWVAEGKGIPPVQSYIEIEPQYLSISLTLKADTKSAMERHQLIRKLESVIVSSAASHAEIDVVYGEVSLSRREPSGFKSYGRGSESNIYLLTPINNGSQVYEATEKLYKFVRSLEIPEDTELDYGATKLAIEKPEEHIKRLKSKIANEIKSTKEIFGLTLKVNITGLSSPVSLVEIKDRKLAVYLPYVIEYRE